MPVGAAGSIFTAAASTPSRAHMLSSSRPNSSSPSAVAIAVEAPDRAAATMALDTSPPQLTA